MTTQEFNAWLERMRLTHRQAAEALCCDWRTIYNYASGAHRVSRVRAELCECLELLRANKLELKPLRYATPEEINGKDV